MKKHCHEHTSGIEDSPDAWERAFLAIVNDFTFNQEVFRHNSRKTAPEKPKKWPGKAVSLMPHCPSSTSGVTAGAGLDLKERSAEKLEELFTLPGQGRKLRIIKRWQLTVLIQGVKRSGSPAFQFLNRFWSSWDFNSSHEERFEAVYKNFLKKNWKAILDPNNLDPELLADEAKVKLLWKKDFESTYEEVTGWPCFLTEEQETRIFQEVLVPEYKGETVGSLVSLLMKGDLSQIVKHMRGSAPGVATGNPKETEAKALANKIWKELTPCRRAMLFDIQYNLNLISYPRFTRAVLATFSGKPTPNWWQVATEHTRHEKKEKDESKATIPLAKRTAEFLEFFVEPHLDESHPFYEFLHLTFRFLPSYWPMWPPRSGSRVRAIRIYPLNKRGDFQVISDQSLRLEQSDISIKVNNGQTLTFSRGDDGSFEIVKKGSGLISGVLKTMMISYSNGETVRQARPIPFTTNSILLESRSFTLKNVSTELEIRWPVAAAGGAPIATPVVDEFKMPVLKAFDHVPGKGLVVPVQLGVFGEQIPVE